MPRISAARRGPPWKSLFVALIVLCLSVQVQTQTTYHCNATTPCYNGACCGVTDGQGVSVDHLNLLAITSLFNDTIAGVAGKQSTLTIIR